jgi:ribosomal protein L13
MDPLDPGKYSIVAFVDDSTNQVMGDLASRVEKALLDAGNSYKQKSNFEPLKIV